MSKRLSTCLLFAVLSSTTDAQRKLTDEEWSADLAVLAQSIENIHPNPFHAIPRGDFQEAVSELRTAIPKLTDIEIVLGLFRLAALIEDGHTKTSGGTEFLSGVLPLRLTVFEEGLFIVAAAEKHRRLLGSRIVAFGGSSAEDVLSAAGAIVSADNPMTRMARAPQMLVLPDVLHTLGASEQTDSVTLTLEDDEHGRFDSRIPAVPLDSRIEWVEALDGQEPQASTGQRIGEAYWYEHLAESKTLYVQFNRIRNEGEQTIAGFFEDVVAVAARTKVERLVLDLRHNGGGNGYYNAAVVESLRRSEHVNQPGRLFTIIGRNTFSAAQLLTVSLERETHTLFVGEPTGGKPNHYGDAKRVSLPNSGIELAVSTRYWEHAGPDDRRAWVEPDIPAPPSARAYFAGLDPALEAVLRYAR